MRKIIISIFIVILIIITYFMLAGNFTIGNFSIKSIKDIKSADEQLKTTIANANKKISQEYVSELEKLKTSIKNMATAKEKYETYNAQGELGLIEIKTYKIEYIWAIVGQYAKNRNTQLTLDLAQDGELYDLKFTLIGDYTDIIDCLSDIEDDDSFDFKIANFAMEPYRKIITTTDTQYSETEKIKTSEEKTTTTTTNTPYEQTETVTEADDETVATSYDPKQLIATFQVEDVGIQFD